MPQKKKNLPLLELFLSLSPHTTSSGLVRRGSCSLGTKIVIITVTVTVTVTITVGVVCFTVSFLLLFVRFFLGRSLSFPLLQLALLFLPCDLQRMGSLAYIYWYINNANICLGSFGQCVQVLIQLEGRAFRYLTWIAAIARP